MYRKGEYIKVVVHDLERMEIRFLLDYTIIGRSLPLSMYRMRRDMLLGMHV